MARKGKENLVSLADRTTEEVRTIAAKGGKRSGEARRAKRDLKECLKLLLEAEREIDGVTASGAEHMATIAFTKALDGDVKWWEIVRDTAGQKPASKAEVDVGADTIDAINSASMTMAEKAAYIKALADEVKADGLK